MRKQRVTDALSPTAVPADVAKVEKERATGVNWCLSWSPCSLLLTPLAAPKLRGCGNLTIPPTTPTTTPSIYVCSIAASWQPAFEPAGHGDKRARTVLHAFVCLHLGHGTSFATLRREHTLGIVSFPLPICRNAADASSYPHNWSVRGKSVSVE